MRAEAARGPESVTRTFLRTIVQTLALEGPKGPRSRRDERSGASSTSYKTKRAAEALMSERGSCCSTARCSTPHALLVLPWHLP